MESGGDPKIEPHGSLDMALRLGANTGGEPMECWNDLQEENQTIRGGDESGKGVTQLEIECFLDVVSEPNR